MAAVTLLFKTQRTSIGSVTLDASVTEAHEAVVDVTDHPVERGAAISDHARPKPEEITIEGFFTSTPMPGATDALVQRTSGDVTFQSRSSADSGRVGSMYSDLLALKDAGELITVVTALATYEDMAITSLSVPRDARSGYGLRFTAKLKRVRVVNSQTVKVRTAEDKTKAKTNLGKKAAPETPEATKKQSGLDWALHGIGWLK